MKKEILSWIYTSFWALLWYFLISSIIIISKINGLSMYPTLNNNDCVVFDALDKKNVQYGDIIGFYSESRGKRLIKRVIGLEGDLIEIKDGFVYRNGTKLDETSYIDVTTDGNISETVKKGYIFVLGDNRPNSADSRYAQIGQIKKEDVLGIAKINIQKQENKVLPKISIIK